MNLSEIREQFKRKVCEQVDIEEQGLGRFAVYTPFMFDDGDHFVVVLKQENERWVFTDEGHTFMHVSYDEIDLSHGTRKSIIDQTLLNFAMTNDSGELRLDVPGQAFGDALFSFVQGLTKITDTRYWTRERVRSTFIDDFKRLMEEKVPRQRRVFEYTDPDNDPDQYYPIDCRINGLARPLFVFAITNNDKCRDATITIHQFERWGRKFNSLAIFEDQTEINQRVLARFSDVVGKQFSNLGVRDRIENYLDEVLRSPAG
jgi:hypothetical protein